MYIYVYIYHRKNDLLTRYPFNCLTVPLKYPLRYIYDTRHIHAAVARSHTDVDPYKRAY